MARICFPSLILALGLAVPLAALAEAGPGPRAGAMADGGRGLANTNDGVFLNPAGLPRFQQYTVEGFWRRDTGRNANQFTLSVLDSKTGPVAGAMAYTWETVGAGAAPRGSRVDVAAGWHLARFLTMGVGVHYLGVGTDEEEVRRFTADLGLMVVPVPWLSLGMTGYNLVNSVEMADVAPRSYGAGVALTPLAQLILTGDWQTSLEREGDPQQWTVGAEYFGFEALAFRAGWTDGGRAGGPRWTAGLGLVTPSFGLDVSYAQSLGDGPETRWFGAGLRLFL